MSKKKKEIFPRPGIQIRLAEKDGKEDVSQIQIFKAGSFYHGYYGGFNLTTELFQFMIENFNKRVYDIDLMIDYDHEVKKAAAWVKSLFLSDDGQELWAEVTWTPAGQKCIEDKEYRYISGDFTMNYVDNETQLEYGPVLYGAALTNRPFLKGMAPNTELNELNGGSQMTLEELKAQNAKLSDENKTIKAAQEDASKRLADVSKEKDEKIASLEKEIESLKLSNQNAEKEKEFNLLLAEKKVVPAQKEAFLKGDMKEFAAKAVKLNEAPAGSGTTEEGGQEGTVDSQEEEKMLKLAEERFKAGGFKSLGDALSAVLSEQKSK